MARRIIKYSNRCLYDAAQARTITLLELSDLVVKGEVVTVERKGSGEDITAVTLLQSVLERLKRHPVESVAPVVLERLLAAARSALRPAGGELESLTRSA